MQNDNNKPTTKKSLKVIKTPPRNPIKSLEHELFSDFLMTGENELSNTVDLWESIPKYFLSPQEQKTLRTAEGLAKPYSQAYTLRGPNGEPLFYNVTIQPALIEQDDGDYKAFFPGKSEEIIEEVLKKIFTEQDLGIHDTKNTESWVKFSYCMIDKELRKNNCSRTFKQIKQSLEIMSKCILTVSDANEEIYTGAILQDYCSVDRSKYLIDTDALHVARLSLFISRAVNTFQFRQYNYKRLMSCKEQLSQWLLRRLINRFTYASIITSHHFLFSTIKQESSLLRAKLGSDNRKKVIKALNELKATGAISTYELEEKMDGRKIVDIKYTVTPTQEFIQEQKAANKRHSLIQETAAKKGILLVDNSDKSRQ